MPCNNGRAETGSPAMTVPGEPSVEVNGDTQKTPPVCREGAGTCEIVQGTVEGGGRVVEYRRTKTSKTFGYNIFRGAPSSTWTPPPPPNFQVIPAVQLDGARPQALGRPVGQSWGLQDRQWLEPVGDGSPMMVHFF